MQEKLKNKLVLPIIALAIIGVIGTAYTLVHAGPTIANAQTPVVKSVSQVGQDKETKDDTVSPKPSPTVQQNADTTENDKADSNTSTNEVENGN